MATRVCPICGRELPLDTRSFEPLAPGDFRVICRRCRSSEQKLKSKIVDTLRQQKDVDFHYAFGHYNPKTGTGPFCKQCKYYLEKERPHLCHYCFETGHSRGTVVEDPDTKRKYIVYPRVCDKFERRRKSK